MGQLNEIHVGAEAMERYLPLVGEDQVRQAREVAKRIHSLLEGRILWNVNSTAAGGGVAEMLRSLLPYARGVGIDVRWLVIAGTPEFFRATKRLHHSLHGSAGDGSTLADDQRAVYEQVLGNSAEELARLVHPGDVVLLHDPQTAGLAPGLVRLGAIVIWRCHVGTDTPNTEVDRGWAWLDPYLRDVHAMVYSRSQYVPECCNHGISAIIPPSVDPFSAKNQDLDDTTVRAILVHAGLIEGPIGGAAPAFRRLDGSSARVDRAADVVRLGRAPDWEAPVVVQVSRWDPLKDPLGVMDGFVQFLNREPALHTELILAGPNVNAIADDPEQATVLDTAVDRWRQLPHAIRNRVHLACLPTADVDENAAIVNALQRHAAVVIQKSLREGFGLTVTEAMWKSRAVLASAVGGIQDQIETDVHGLLLQDPTDLEAFASALSRLLEDRNYAEQLGKAAHRRVQEHYLALRHLGQYADLLQRVVV